MLGLMSQTSAMSWYPIVGSGSDPPKIETICINKGDKIEFEATSLTISVQSDKETESVVSVTNAGTNKKIIALNTGTVDIVGSVSDKSKTLFHVEVEECRQSYSCVVESSFKITGEDGAQDWASSDTSIATISSTAENVATVQCNKIGRSVITYSYRKSFIVSDVLTGTSVPLDFTVVGSFDVEVTPPSFDQSTCDVYSDGGLTTLSLNYKGTGSVKWLVDDESIVKIVPDKSAPDSKLRENTESKSSKSVLRGALPRLMALDNAHDGESGAASNNTVTLQALGREGTAYVIVQVDIDGQCFSSAIPVRTAPVVITLNPINTVVDKSMSTAPEQMFMLIVEGLGTDPAVIKDNIIFESSDETVVSVLEIDSGSRYGDTGVQYIVKAIAKATGSSIITAKITDMRSHTTYTRSGTVVVRGIIAEPQNVTLEVGEACVIFAKRYGFESNQIVDLTWGKNGPDKNNWIRMELHGNKDRQKEAYYVKGLSEGTGIVTVALGTTYFDTISVTVVPRKSVTIQQDNVEVAEHIVLSEIGNTANLKAVCEGFTNPTFTWVSSDDTVVSVTPVENNTAAATISRLSYSDTMVAITVTATEEGVIRTKTVYVAAATSTPVLKITSARVTVDSALSPRKNITLVEGETVTLSAQTLVLDSTATIWTVTDNKYIIVDPTTGETTTYGPLVKLSSTVGKNITVTGRLSTSGSDKVKIIAQNGRLTDDVYITVTPSEQRAIRIIGADIGADGVIVLSPTDISTLKVELRNFSSSSRVTWSALVAQNNENPRGIGVCPVSLNPKTGLSTTVTADMISTDFAKITVSATEGKKYTDEVYVKVTGCDIISAAKYITLFKGDVVTLQTENEQSADWRATSKKTYVGDNPPIDPDETTQAVGKSTTVTTVGTTTNPSKIIATQGANTDATYVFVKVGGDWGTVSFDLNGGCGMTPDTVVVSSDDTIKSIILKVPDAHYPSDDGEYEFYGWSEFRDAGEPDANRSIFFPDQTYSMPSNANKTLYAIWAKKFEDALFVIRLSGDIGAEPKTQIVGNYAKSGIQIKGALSSAGFYYNVHGVDAHLAKVPSEEDIVRVISLSWKTVDDQKIRLTYDPNNDRVIWYVIKRVSNDAAGLPNWHVDGVLVKGNKVSLTYEQNISVANLVGMINPPCSFYDVDDLVSISNHVPTCRDYYFIGWNTEPDGTGQWYTYTGRLYQNFEADSVLTSFNITENTTLYAIWTGINLRKVWIDDGDRPEEVRVTFKGREYVLSNSNLWCMQVVADTSSSSEEPVEVLIPGYMSSIRTQSMMSISNIKSVTYTITNTFVKTLELSGGDGTSTVGTNASFRIPNILQDTMDLAGNDGTSAISTNTSSIIPNVFQDTIELAGNDGTSTVETSTSSMIPNVLQDTMELSGSDGTIASDTNTISEISNTLDDHIPGHLIVMIAEVSKPVNGQNYVLGEEITYEIVVTNDGNVTLTDIDVTDTLTRDTYRVGTCKPGESSKPIKVKYVVTEADILAGKVVNQAIAIGKDPYGNDVSNESDSIELSVKVTEHSEFVKTSDVFSMHDMILLLLLWMISGYILKSKVRRKRY